jgi:drug/metabolite transporter (DMT)-like permease
MECAMNRTAVLYALTSAALFGLSTPAAKVLVGSIQPVTLAGLLYCAALALASRRCGGSYLRLSLVRPKRLSLGLTYHG